MIITLGGRAAGRSSAQQGGGESAPSYIAALAAGEVAQLTSVSTGATTLRGAASAAWQADPSLNPPPSGEAQTDHLGGITAFSGGFGDNTDKIAYRHGGGHGDGAYPGIIGFDFKGDTPGGFFLVPGSEGDENAAPSDWDLNNSFTNGAPASVHSYDQLIYDETNKVLYRMGGSIWSGSGGATGNDYKFGVGENGAGGSWADVTAADRPTMDLGQASVYDPSTGKVFFTKTGFNTGYIWRVGQAALDNADDWSGFKDNHGSDFEATGVWIASLGRGYILGDSVSAYFPIDFSTETVSEPVSLSPTGDTGWTTDTRLGAVWDPTLEVIWIFNGRNTDGRLWRFDPSTEVSTEITLTGDSFPVSTPGSWKAFCFMDDWRALGLILGDTDNAYVIRLPSS